MNNEEDIQHVTEVIGELVDYRKEHFRQSEVAKIMNTHQGRVSDIEILRWDLRLSTLMKYARAIGKKIRITIEDTN